jgi:hypothetical protein
MNFKYLQMIFVDNFNFVVERKGNRPVKRTTGM